MELKDATVQFGVPMRYEGYSHALIESFLKMKKPKEVKFTPIARQAIDVARNLLVGWLKEDWLLMMDDDMSFPPETLERLLSWDKPIVSGVYFQSRTHPIPHIYQYSEVKDGKYFYRSLKKEVAEYLYKHKDMLQDQPCAVTLPREEALIECDGVGGGCLLIHKSVFEKLEHPYFKCVIGQHAGEDFYFCRNAQQAGFKIYADMGVLCGHFFQVERGFQQFMAYVSNGEISYPWDGGYKQNFNDEGEIFNTNGGVE